MMHEESLAMLTRGRALGFSIAAPVGPIGVLCIRGVVISAFGVWSLVALRGEAS